MTGDPFDTAALRDSVLSAWRSSPTRLREDTATEADLVRAGYRDRLLTELAQNAADAAGSGGRMAVWLVDDELHVANTGTPLTTRGVQALTALRASGKAVGSVGRFGVGFTAVLSVSEEIEVRSTAGSARFSAARTRSELGGVDGDVPVLRLVWPADAQPEPGWDTEIVLRLRTDVDGPGLIAEYATEAVDLSLELPALEMISIADVQVSRIDKDLGDGLSEVTIGARRWWEFRTPRARWLLPIVDGMPTAAGPDVLRAPTRSDEELSLPALLVADVAMQPDRRRLLPGHPVADLASGYADFARALPARHRLTLVPAAGFPRSEVDAALREALLAELRHRRWLPVVMPDIRPDAEQGDSRPMAVTSGNTEPVHAHVFPGLTDALSLLLAEVVPGLVAPELSGDGSATALARLDVPRIGLVHLAELLGGITRPPRWWHDLYAAIEPLVVDRLAVEELGALPVPLTDGRLVTGPRTVLTAELDEAVSVPWARVVHPDAAHPLLARLGARSATSTDLLADPALRDALSTDHEDLVDAVLRLAGQAPTPADLPGWLGELELRDSTDNLRPADELLLPGAPLGTVLIADSPFGEVAADLVSRYGRPALQAVGVGWSFTLLVEEDPTGPDHDLDDEQRWWDSLAEDPPVLTAVRDLDLVDDAKWPAALSLLAADDRTADAMRDRMGYTAWWLRRHARLGDMPIGSLCHPDDSSFAGLLSAVDHPDADALRALLVDPAAIDVVTAQALVDALADAGRTPTPAVIAYAHRLLAAADVDSDDIALPPQVRAVTGRLVDPDHALVLDVAWFAAAIDPDRLVIGDIATAGALATLLDVSPVSEAVTAEVVGTGRRSSWEREAFAVLLRTVVELPCAAGDLVVHDTLEVCLTGAVEATVQVPWWVDGKTTHIARVTGILSR